MDLIGRAESQRHASAAAARILAGLGDGAGPDLEAVEVLCALAFAADPEVSQFATRTLFAGVVEKICDGFLPGASQYYDLVFARAVSFCRNLPELAEFDRLLTEAGLPDEGSILVRRRRLSGRKFPVKREIRKAIVLSRVTVGADIAVTSVVVRHLLDEFPNAELVLLGHERLAEIFGGDERIKVRGFRYGRGSGLAARMRSWVDLFCMIRSELGEGVVVFDPDSRLTQLGLLPVADAEFEEDSYFFFDSREAGGSGSASLSELANEWMQSVLGTGRSVSPYLSLLESDRQAAGLIADRSAGGVVTVSLGVGGNLAKKVSEDLECFLLDALVQKFTVVLDCGASEEELREAEAHLARLSARGVQVVTAGELQGSGATVSGRVFAWRGGIGSFAAMITASAGYVGYDSSGQHIAAALGIPCLVVFVNTGSELFRWRWRPSGPGGKKIVDGNGLDENRLGHELNEFMCLLKP